jgi:hypothetical protein
MHVHSSTSEPVIRRRRRDPFGVLGTLALLMELTVPPAQAATSKAYGDRLVPVRRPRLFKFAVVFAGVAMHNKAGAMAGQGFDGFDAVPAMVELGRATLSARAVA